VTYPGGKNGAGVAQRIVNLAPPHHTYIEPFLGSGAVMRLKRPARLNIGVDLDPEPVKLLASLFRASGSTSAETAAAGDGRPRPGARADSGDGAGSRALSSERPRRTSPRPTIADPDCAVAVVTSDQVMTTNPSAGSGEGRSIFQFRVGDGIEYLERAGFAGDGRELVYCDPPYLMLSERSGRAVYEHEMAEESHLRLLRLLRKLPCRILISGYWSALYANELRQWKRITFEGHTRQGTKTEWLWFNYPEPVELHDYRFLGRGFRERERIKRKVSRWTARLQRMPTLERQALLSAIAGSGGNGER
jgi:DNA adenine methylase